MITRTDISRLLAVQAPESALVSMYLDVPLDPAERRGLTARVGELLTPGAGESWEQARRTELPAIRDAVNSHAPEWLGHSVAIFACSGIGMLETIPLHGHVAERAVLGTRPYLRPLLAEVRRHPPYTVAVTDHKNAWLFRVSGESIEQAGVVRDETVGSRRFGGWYGLQSYRNEQRARRLAQQHYTRTQDALAGAAPDDPIVIGGHETETTEFVGSLSAVLRERVAGTFVIDPHTMTPARVRGLADDVLAGWVRDRERRDAIEITQQPPGGPTATGLDACLAAANQRAVGMLMVADDAVRPGFACDGCGALAVTGGKCPVCGSAVHATPDVIEDLAVKVTEDGGTVEPVGNGTPLPGVAARLRFPPAP